MIIPLMQHDVVTTYHWMTAAQFLSAVALGQVTPGPVVQTVAVVGYAAAGVGGGLFAAAIAFSLVPLRARRRPLLWSFACKSRGAVVLHGSGGGRNRRYRGIGDHPRVLTAVLLAGRRFWRAGCCGSSSCVAAS